MVRRGDKMDDLISHKVLHCSLISEAYQCMLQFFPFLDLVKSIFFIYLLAFEHLELFLAREDSNNLKSFTLPRVVANFLNSLANLVPSTIKIQSK
jgi:amino acid permease